MKFDVEELALQVLKDLDEIHKDEGGLIRNANVLMTIRNALEKAHLEGGKYEEDKLAEERYLKRAARYCAAIVWAKVNSPERLKNISATDMDRADMNAEEWLHMYIDGPDVGINWEKFELTEKEYERDYNLIQDFLLYYLGEDHDFFPRPEDISEFLDSKNKKIE